VRSHVLSEHADAIDVVLIEELGLRGGAVRADMAVVNGALHGYEIKSDRDSFRRLEKQAKAYNQVFDTATLIVGPTHANAAGTYLHPWWGIVIADATLGEPRFDVIRAAEPNPERDARALVQFLWREDAIALLEKKGACRGVRSKPRDKVWDRICECCQLDEIAAAVRDHLKRRPALLAAPRPS
jgi:hypothetical protein